MGSNFLRKRDERDQAFFDAGMDVGFQKCLDYVMNALRDPKVVGKDSWGEKRLLALNLILREYDDYFHPEWNPKNKKADILQRDLDARLKEGCGKYFAPFEERYPYLKEIGYNKPQKGWTD